MYPEQRPFFLKLSFHISMWMYPEKRPALCENHICWVLVVLKRVSLYWYWGFCVAGISVWPAGLLMISCGRHLWLASYSVVVVNFVWQASLIGQLFYCCCQFCVAGISDWPAILLLLPILCGRHLWLASYSVVADFVWQASLIGQLFYCCCWFCVAGISDWPAGWSGVAGPWTLLRGDGRRKGWAGAVLLTCIRCFLLQLHVMPCLI